MEDNIRKTEGQDLDLPETVHLCERMTKMQQTFFKLGPNLASVHSSQPN